MRLFAQNNNTLNTMAGVCPNCWGQQEYAGKAINLMEDKQIDVNNSTSRYTFIRDFVVNYVSGIRLKKHNQGYVCTSCQKQNDRNREISL